VDKQADPVAEPAADAAGGAPEADAADRQPSLAKKGSGQERSVTRAAPQQAAAAAPEPSVFSPRPKPSSGSDSSVSARLPSFLRGNRKRSDATVPLDLASQAGVRKASGGLRPSADGDEGPAVPAASVTHDGAASDGTQEMTSTLAAAALARELTGAGFATPGFATPGFAGPVRPPAAGPDEARPAPAADEAPAAVTGAEVTATGSSSPSGWMPPSGQSPSSAVTNPEWPSPEPQPDGQGPARWNSPNAGPAAPLGAGYADPASPGTWPAAAAAAGFAAGTALSSAAADQTVAAPGSEPVQPPYAGPGYQPPVTSEDQEFRAGGPLAQPGEKKLRPNAGAKPGGAIGNGRAPMSLKSNPGAAARPSPKSRQERAEVRDAQLVLSRIEPWSVMKFSFLISLVAFIVLFVVVMVLYFAFSALGVFQSIEQTFNLVTSSKGNPGTNAASWFSASTVLGYTLVAGAIDVALITALSTVGAVIYNAVTRLTGGIEITLAEAD
jgi:Transmembrane domain of unknown function (DUF3566)